MNTTNSGKTFFSAIPFYSSWSGQICTSEEERDRSISRSGEFELYLNNHWNIKHTTISLLSHWEYSYCFVNPLWNTLNVCGYSLGGGYNSFFV